MLKFYKENRNYYSLFWPVLFSVFLTNVLNIIDAIMVTNYNEMGITSITAATQVNFLFGPIYFAIMTGINAYVVQYYHRKEYSDVKQFAGIAAILMSGLGLINFLLIVFFKEQIIGFFIPIDSVAGQLGIEYITVIKYSMLIIPIEQFFMHLFRSTSKPKIPLYISFFSSIINILFNFFLIYGILFFPELGIAGAALATVIARFSSVAIYIYVSYKLKVSFIGKISQMFSFSKRRFIEVFKSTLPLIIVEFGFGIGSVLYTKIYSYADIEQFNAYNIARSTEMLINCFISASVTVTGIVTGSAIARNATIKKAKEVMHTNMIFLTINSVIMLMISIFILPQITHLFGETSNQFSLIRNLVIISGIWLSIRVFSSSFLAILRSGSDNRYVIWIDAGTTFVFGLPLTLLALVVFGPNIIILRSVIIIDVIIKFIFGYLRIKKYKWVKKL